MHSGQDHINPITGRFDGPWIGGPKKAKKSSNQGKYSRSSDQRPSRRVPEEEDGKEKKVGDIDQEDQDNEDEDHVGDDSDQQKRCDPRQLNCLIQHSTSSGSSSVVEEPSEVVQPDHDDVENRMDVDADGSVTDVDETLDNDSVTDADETVTE